MERKQVLQTQTGLERLIDSLSPDFSGKEAHRVHLLIATGSIITAVGMFFLVTQLTITLAVPSLPPAPWTDIVMDIAVVLAGGFTLWLVRSGHVRLAAWIVLSFLWAVAATQLYLRGEPPTDMVSSFGLFMVVVLAIVLLDQRRAWMAWTVAASMAFISAHLLWLGGYLPPLMERAQNRSGQALFSIISWLTCTGIILVVLGSAVNMLRDQAETLELRIAERKQAEERLSFQSMLLDQIDDMVIATDLEGRITYVNEAECRVFGKTADELIGQHVEEYGEDPDCGAMQKEIIENTLSEGQWRGEVVNIPEDGQKIILDSRTQLIYDERGEPMGMVGISTDITERKEIERQLRQQERLAAVGQLAAGIAHDFRNLLSTIILYAQLCLRNRKLSPDLAQNLQTIVDESYKATDLVQQMLDFSSRAMIRPRPLDLVVLIEDVLEVLARTIPEHIYLTLDAQNMEPGAYTVKADPGRIQQVLTNLTLNARDAMPEGGTLQFAVSAVEVKCGETPPVADMDPGDWGHLTVSDTGTGMTEEVQEHLFEPFFTTKDVDRGTGLGLAQVYGIIRQHKGHIEVETELGEGTTFHIYFPVYEQRPEEIDAREPVPTPKGLDETILLVEDEEELLEAAQAMLKSLGYRVVTATNGREALAKCQIPRWSGGWSRQIDLVITDLVMPKMGGRELMHELQKTKPNLPVLAITGYALQEEDLETLKDMGFVDVIFKPFEVGAWAQYIRRALAA